MSGRGLPRMFPAERERARGDPKREDKRAVRLVEIDSGRRIPERRPEQGSSRRSPLARNTIPTEKLTFGVTP